HSLWTAVVNAVVVRLGSVRLSPVRFVRSVVSHVLAMPSWRASCARSAAIIDDQAAAIAGSVGAQVGMSPLRVLVTVGLATVARQTAPATLKFGSPPHENRAFVLAQPLDRRYGLLLFIQFTTTLQSVVPRASVTGQRWTAKPGPASSRWTAALPWRRWSDAMSRSRVAASEPARRGPIVAALRATPNPWLAVGAPWSGAAATAGLRRAACSWTVPTSEP